MTRTTTSLAVTFLLAFVGTATAAERPFVPVTDAMLANPDPADWLMWRRTSNSWGYSPLATIDRGNVARLTLAWSMDLDAGPSQEGIPLVHDGIMYFPQPLDVTTAMNAATGQKLWEHRRPLPADLGQFVPFPQTNRNLAIYGRLIIDNGADDSIYALDAVTGEQGARRARVLAGDDVRLPENLERARAGIGEIADRRGDDVEGSGRHGQRVAGLRR